MAHVANCGCSGTRGDGKWASLLSNILWAWLFLPLLTKPPWPEQHLNTHTHRGYACVWSRPPKLLPAKRLLQEGKSFWQPRSWKWQPAASRWTPCAEASLPRPRLPPLYTTVNCFDLHLHPVPGVWSCCIHSAFWPEHPHAHFPSLYPTETGHHENLQAADELCFSDLGSARLVLVHGKRNCWQRGL